MDKEILKIIKNIKGSLLGIGLDNEKYLEAIQDNDNINVCYILSAVSLTGKKFNITKKGRNKKINIKKIKKQFKKKSLDIIICNFNTIKQFQRSFISNSIYLNKGFLYIYGNKCDLENVKAKYQRYTKDIQIIEKGDMFLLKINNQNTKNNFFKDLKYKLSDLINDILDFMTDLLIN